jgi:hypothetical protein
MFAFLAKSPSKKADTGAKAAAAPAKQPRDEKKVKKTNR